MSFGKASRGGSAPTKRSDIEDARADRKTEKKRWGGSTTHASSPGCQLERHSTPPNAGKPSHRRATHRNNTVHRSPPRAMSSWWIGQNPFPIRRRLRKANDDRSTQTRAIAAVSDRVFRESAVDSKRDPHSSGSGWSATATPRRSKENERFIAAVRDFVFVRPSDSEAEPDGSMCGRREERGVGTANRRRGLPWKRRGKRKGGNANEERGFEPEAFGEVHDRGRRRADTDDRRSVIGFPQATAVSVPAKRLTEESTTSSDSTPSF